MSTAISEKIRAGQERFSASTEAAANTIRQTILEQSAAMVQAQAEIEQQLQQELRVGMEKKALAASLTPIRTQAERHVKLFESSLATLEDDSTATETLNTHLHEAQRFLAWLRHLESRISAPAAFDESKLGPTPAGPTAEGFISINEARNRLRVRKEP